MQKNGLAFIRAFSQNNAKLGQQIELKTKYVQLKSFPKPFKFYTDPVCVACQIE